jgi:hypothetical protein
MSNDREKHHKHVEAVHHAHAAHAAHTAHAHHAAHHHHADAKVVAKDATHAIRNVTHAMSNAVEHMFKGGGKAFTHVSHGAPHRDAVHHAAHKAAQHHSSGGGGIWGDICSFGSHMLHGAEHVGSHMLHGAEHLGKDVFHDAKNGLYKGLQWGSQEASNLGLGHVMDAMGLGKVNPHDVAMNHHITKTYHDQSKELNKVLGKGSGANWATFASWASNRAGQAIQNHDDPGGRFGRDADQLLSKMGIDGPVKTWNKEYNAESSQAAKGNQKVFHDISPRIQKFIDTFKGTSKPDQKKWDKFAAGFHGHESDMLKGFHNYYKAMFQHGSDKAQSVTLGNLQLGLHEQKLLQPNISGAIPKGQGGSLTPGQTVRVGKQVLHLSNNVTPSHADHGHALPEDLRHITNPELKSMLAQWGPQHGTLHGSGAHDWSNLHDRMKFISGLFLSYQQDPSLFENPLDTNPMG